MNATTKPRATKSTKIIGAACELFGIGLEEAAKRIPAILYALEIRQACGRCGGTGSYSFCQTHGSRCFGCNGRGDQAAPLTAATLEAARAKVAAGELEAFRAKVRAKQAAKREIAPLVEAARAIYMVIGAEYDAAYRADRGQIPEALCIAQGLNNDIFWGTQVKGGKLPGITGIQTDVKIGIRVDYLEARAEVLEATAALEALVAAWSAYKAAQ